jgi:hypothetical protein
MVVDADRGVPVTEFADGLVGGREAFCGTHDGRLVHHHDLQVTSQIGHSRALRT